jgi:hypothetical protein
MALEPGFAEYAAQKGNYYFEIIPAEIEHPTSRESSAVAADGVDDFDRLLDFMDRFPKTKVSVDIGIFNGILRTVTKEDVQELRDTFVAFNGEVPKINVYTQPAVSNGIVKDTERIV